MKILFYFVASGFFLLASIVCVVLKLYEAAQALRQIDRTFERALSDPYDLPYQPHQPRPPRCGHELAREARRRCTKETN